MKKSRHSEEKIIAAVKQMEGGRKTARPCSVEPENPVRLSVKFCPDERLTHDVPAGHLGLFPLSIILFWLLNASRRMRPIPPSCSWSMAGVLSAATPATCRPIMERVLIKASSAW